MCIPVDNFVLASLSINPKRDPKALIEPDEFKLQGKRYIRCSALAKAPKHTKKQTSIIWVYGEDIQSHNRKKFWYCYFCEKQHRHQELPTVGKGNTTALDHLESKHSINRSTGELKEAGPKDANQLSLSDCNDLKTFIFARKLDIFKDLLVRWIVYCHIAFFQIENVYFRDLLFYIFPGLAKVLPKAAATLRQ